MNSKQMNLMYFPDILLPAQKFIHTDDSPCLFLQAEFP